MNKIEQISKALSGLIADGDAYAITGKNGAVEVNPISDKDALKTLNSDLHGKLLAYEQRILGDGAEVWFFLLGALLVDILVATNLTAGFGLDLAKLQTWWVYLGAFAVSLTLNVFRLNARAKKEFAKLSASILSDVEKAHITKGELLSLIANDSKLYNVRNGLMLSV